MKIGIFTGATSVRSKNIFTDITRYPTGKHEIQIVNCWLGDWERLINVWLQWMIDNFYIKNNKLMDLKEPRKNRITIHILKENNKKKKNKAVILQIKEGRKG